MSLMVIYIAGVPACGKTTLCRLLRAVYLKDAVPFKDGRVRGIRKGEFEMLGVFDGSTFEGTDKLSMTVIEDAIPYLERLRTDGGQHIVFVEGDRLFNERFIRASGARVFVVDAGAQTLAYRHSERRDTQSGTFLKGRRTKVERLIALFRLERHMNDTRAQQTANINQIMEWVKSWRITKAQDGRQK